MYSNIPRATNKNIIKQSAHKFTTLLFDYNVINSHRLNGNNFIRLLPYSYYTIHTHTVITQSTLIQSIKYNNHPIQYYSTFDVSSTNDSQIQHDHLHESYSNGLLDRVRSDHAHINDLYTEYKNSCDNDDKEQICQAIINEIIINQQCVSDIVFPAMIDHLPEHYRVLYDTSVSHQQHIKQLIGSMIYDEPVMYEQLDNIMSDYYHHARYIENDIIPAMKLHLPPDTLITLGDTYMLQKNKYKNKHDK